MFVIQNRLRIVLLMVLFIFPFGVSAMTDLNGRPSNITKYVGKGKWLIVEAWHSSCHICGRSMPALSRVLKAIPNAHIMSVSLDGNRQVAIRFLKQHRIRIPTLVSSIREFDYYLRRIAKTSLKGTPTYLIFNPKGQLIGLESGYLSSATIKQFVSVN